MLLEKEVIAMRKKREKLKLWGKTYTVLRTYAPYAGAESCAVTDGTQLYVLRDFPACSEAEFASVCSRKVQLAELGIPIPRMAAADSEKRLLLEAYLEGENAEKRRLRGALNNGQLQQLRTMAETAERSGCCLDYHPENYRLCKGILYYTHWVLLPYSREASLAAHSDLWKAPEMPCPEETN